MTRYRASFSTLGGLMILLVAAAADTSDVLSNSDEGYYRVPTFALSDLLGRRRHSDLAAALASTGLIAVTGVGSSVDGTEKGEEDPHGIVRSRSTALGGLCRCASGSSALLEVDGTDSAVLGDGTTSRLSVATATAGNTPLPLPAGGIDAACATGLSGAMEDLRDRASEASRAFTAALDGLLEEAVPASRGAKSDLAAGEGDQSIRRPALMRTTPDAGFQRTYASVSSILDGARHLEHFHVYSKDGINSEEDERIALDLHTDAGLFLSFIPAFPCDNEGGIHDESFLVSVPSSNQSSGHHILQKAVFPPNSVAIMLGIGAEKWLNTPRDEYGNSIVPLRATRHAVRMEPGQKRAWYGMMHLVPDKAIIQETLPLRTFADMRKSMASYSKRVDTRHFGDVSEHDIDKDAIAIGCGVTPTSSPLDHPDTASTFQRRGRRRLQMVSDASQCNNRTNFYCWMSCLEIPDVESAAERIDEGQALYCLDPATLAASDRNVAAAANQCNIAGVVGAAMNEACTGSWQDVVDTVPHQEVIVDRDDPNDQNEGGGAHGNMHMGEEPYCYGATSMYMRGFQWIGTTCIVYLFPSWVLSSGAKLAGACIGTIAFGACLEGVIHARRRVLASIPPGWVRLAASTGLYGLQLTIGYLVMLVVMTYSGPLFLSVILGLMFGHASFNYKALVRPNKQGGQENEDQAEGTVPEGGTPCCQNDLGAMQYETRERSSWGSGNKINDTAADASTGSVTEDTSPCCCDPTVTEKGAKHEIAVQGRYDSFSGNDSKVASKLRQVTCCSGAEADFVDEGDVEAAGHMH